MREFIKLIITTILLPLMLVLLVGVLFIGIHEGIWHYKDGKANPEQQ